MTTTADPEQTPSTRRRRRLPLTQPPTVPDAQGRSDPTLPRHDLPVLEGIRGIAAIMVLITHVGFYTGAGVNGPWRGWLSRLDIGVALFFLLSGFLLFRAYVLAHHGDRPPVRTRAYLRRRFVRIYPAFLLVLAANWVMTPKARQDPISLWLQTVVLIQNYQTSFAAQLNGLVQIWSLVVEVSFYVTLPIFAWLVLGPRSGTASARQAARDADDQNHPDQADHPDQAGRTPTRRQARATEHPSFASRVRAVAVLPAMSDVAAARRPAVVMLLMAAVAIGWRTYFTVSSQGLATQLLWLPAFLDWFAAGMAMAWLRERPAPVPRRITVLADHPGVCWSLALALFWLSTTGLAGPYGLEGASTTAGLFKHLIYIAITVLLLLPPIFGSSAAGWRVWATHPALTWLGQISFGVFLWHPMLMDAIRRLLDWQAFTGGFWVTLALTLVFSLIAGTLSWRYLEEPCQRRWGRR